VNRGDPAHLVIDARAGSVPWATYNLIGKRPWVQRHFDDTLGVVHTHLVAGALGGFLTGIFATKDGDGAFGLTAQGGGIYGNGMQIGYQLAGSSFIFGWNVIGAQSDIALVTSADMAYSDIAHLHVHQVCLTHPASHE
jgi:Amt family ammonium transporter